jgi:cobyrinic acid a,c-diamide synthase
MSDLPRFSLGTVQPEAELCPVFWALLDTLERTGWHVQSFQSVATLAPVCGVRSITGQSQRHLDSWLMSGATCREVFDHGSRASDLSIVSGSYDSAKQGSQKSSLDTLSQWLELPQLVVIDVQQIQGCRLPTIPAQAAGLFLDKVRDSADALRWQTSLEALYGVPVLGHLNRATKLRSLIDARATGSPCRELCRALGERLEPTLRLEKLLRLAHSGSWHTAPPRLFAAPNTDDRIKIAVAYDEVFQGYFADTLDALEARGAAIADFSPLHGDALPLEADIVYLAGTRIEPWAAALSRNICMKEALRAFVHRGGRVYAEGAGLAYLCERLVSATGEQFPMVGLIPAIALQKPPVAAYRPAELSLGVNAWLGSPGMKLRGYADDSLELLPSAELSYFAEEVDHRYDLVGAERVIGTRLQVDFAAQPHLLSSFFRPRQGALVAAY